MQQHRFAQCVGVICSACRGKWNDVGRNGSPVWQREVPCGWQQATRHSSTSQSMCRRAGVVVERA
jgi:hypothetical protein